MLNFHLVQSAGVELHCDRPSVVGESNFAVGDVMGIASIISDFSFSFSWRTDIKFDFGMRFLS